MIIPNGFIQFISAVRNGGIDEVTGYPKNSDTERTAPIPCQFYSNSLNMLGRNNGEANTRRSFTILIDEDAVPAVTERLELYDVRGKSLGQYSASSVIPLTAVCQCKIIV